MCVYLIHFDTSFHHARHYLGYAADVPKRVRRHRRGDGAKLLRAVQNAGIGWEVVRVWAGAGKDVERRLKARKKAAGLCPKCLAAKVKT